MRRESRVVFLPCETLFLRGSDNLAVSYQAGCTVVIESGNSQDIHRGSLQKANSVDAHVARAHRATATRLESRWSLCNEQYAGWPQLNQCCVEKCPITVPSMTNDAEEPLVVLRWSLDSRAV